MATQWILIILLLIYVLLNLFDFFSRIKFHFKRKKMVIEINKQCGGCWHLQMPKYGTGPRAYNALLGCREYIFIARNSTGQHCMIFVTEDGKTVTPMPWK